MKRLLTLILMVLAGNYLAANNVQIKNLSYTAINGGTQYQLSFDISWENAWRLDGGVVHQDAVWFFAKYKTPANPNWQHLKLEANAVETAGQLEYKVTADQIGAFIYLNTDKVGNVNNTQFTVKSDILPSPSSLADIKVFAVEMVKVPEGPFWFGDGSDQSFFGSKNLREPVAVTGSGNLEIESIGGFWVIQYFSTEGFYCMKYEISMSQYIAYLNTLSLAQQDACSYLDLSQPLSPSLFQDSIVHQYNVVYCRNKDGSNGIPQEPLEIYLDAGNNQVFNEFEDGMEFPMVNLSSNDLYRYLDWAGLRPMALGEYEKACRGPLYPVENEFSWGTPHINAMEMADTSANTVFRALVRDSQNPNTSFLYRVGVTANANTQTRHSSSASYYGIMDLTGGVTEGALYMNTQYTPIINQHGDGNLDANAEHFILEILNASPLIYGKGGSFLGRIDNDNSRKFITVSGYYSSFLKADERKIDSGGRGVRTID